MHLKTKLRLSLDNRSVANTVIQFPLQKLFTFCSVFTDLLPPKDFSQALDAARKVPPVGTERQVKQFCSSLLGGGGMQVGVFEGAEQLLVPWMDAQGIRCLAYFGF